VSDWEIIENPDWAGMEPSGLTESACHDRTHCLDIRCSCGETMHMHESQLDGMERVRIGSRCKGCGELLLFEPGYFHAAFVRMRAEGWIL